MNVEPMVILANRSFSVLANRAFGACFLTAALSTMTPGVASADTYLHDFDTGTAQSQSWSGASNCRPPLRQTGGNPSGHLRSCDGGGAFFHSNHADFLGDYSGKTWSFSFDLEQGSGEISVADLTFLGAGGNLWSVRQILPPGQAGWRTVTFHFDPGWSDAQAQAAGWSGPRQLESAVRGGVPLATWAQVMRDVEGVHIFVPTNMKSWTPASPLPNPEMGLDNVVLRSH